MENKIYYLDYNATTPLNSDIFKVMEPYFKDYYGNPASIYGLGRESLKAIQKARGQVAALIHAKDREIIFTSGGTESNNLAIRGALKLNPSKNKIITSTVEHSSVRNVFRDLEKEGAQVFRVAVNKNGELNLQELEKLLSADVALVSVMWANNETGVIFPIEDVAKLVKKHGILFHVDAVQAAGKIKIDVSKIPVDLLSISAHKFYGPKGVGALFVRESISLPPMIVGGHQEREKRAGTENVPAIVGMGEAARLAVSYLENKKSIGNLRDRLETLLLSSVPDSFVNGGSVERVSNTVNLTIPGALAEVLIPRLDEEGICVSSGSACLTGALEPSLVLRAMGLTEEFAKSSIRLSLGNATSEKEIDHVIQVIPRVVKEIRDVRKKELVTND